MRRVVITGAGTVNALGRNVAQTWGAMKAALSGIAALHFRDVDRLTIKIGAQIHDWDGAEYFEAASLSQYDRFTQYAMVAASEAIAMAGEIPRTAGVIIGSAAGGIHTWEDNYRSVFEEGKNRVPPLTVPRLMMNAGPSQISMRFDLHGPSFAVSSACASSNHAIGQAYRLIREGNAEAMIAGGAEAMLLFGGVKAWEGLRVLSPDGCRPFAANRNGMVMGEGAAVFVLEERSYALARGADILAEVAGFGMTADAGELLTPSIEGAHAAIMAAMADARLSPCDIGYINAHGTGTKLNDRNEAAAIRSALGQAIEGCLVSSTKAMHGHAIGATGAIELLAVILALREGIIAPTLNLHQIDAECDLDHVANETRRRQVTAALSNAFAFGGLNAVLALKSA